MTRQCALQHHQAATCTHPCTPICAELVDIASGCVEAHGLSVHTSCRVYLPVFVEGANLSMGDMHFSQGDGEVRVATQRSTQAANAAVIPAACTASHSLTPSSHAVLCCTHSCLQVSFCGAIEMSGFLELR